MDLFRDMTKLLDIYEEIEERKKPLTKILDRNREHWPDEDDLRRAFACSVVMIASYHRFTEQTMKIMHNIATELVVQEMKENLNS